MFIEACRSVYRTPAGCYVGQSVESESNKVIRHWLHAARSDSHMLTSSTQCAASFTIRCLALRARIRYTRSKRDLGS